MSEVVEKKRLLDGTIVSSKFFCVKVKEDFRLSSNFTVKFHNHHDFKGLKFEPKEGHQTVRIVLGQTVNNLQASLVLIIKNERTPAINVAGRSKEIPVPKMIEIENSEEDIENSLQKYGKLAMEYLEASVKKSEENKPLCKNNWDLQNPTHRIIQPSHVKSIMYEMKQKLEKNTSSIYSRFVFSRLGQNESFEEIERYLEEYFEVRQIEEMVIHCAVDFTKISHALFYDKEKLNQYFKTLKDQEKVVGLDSKYTRPKSEFFVCLLHGLGNFYYDVDWISKLDGEVKCVDAKFYSEAFKYMHKKEWNEVMFTYADIANRLMDPRDFSKQFCTPVDRSNRLQSRLMEVEKVQKAVNEVGDPRKTLALTSRFEVIICLKGKTLLDAKKTIMNLVDNVFRPSEIKNCIVSVPLPDLMKHLKINLDPCLSTMRTYLMQRISKNKNESAYKDSLQSSDWKGKQFHFPHMEPMLSSRTKDLDQCFNFTPQMYLNCVAAEAIVALSLYGNVYWRNKGFGSWKKGQARERKPFPEWLIKDLGIEKKNWSKKPIKNNLKTWLFDSAKITKEGLVKFHCETFPIQSLLETIKGYFHSESKFFLEELIALERIMRNHREEEVLKHCVKLAEVLSRAILDISAKNLLHQLPNGYKTFTLEKKLRLLRSGCNGTETSRAISIAKFIKMILKAELEFFSFVSFLMGIAEYLLKDEMKILNAKLLLQLENLVFQECMFLIVPDSSRRGSLLAIIPTGDSLEKVRCRMKICDAVRLGNEYDIFIPVVRNCEWKTIADVATVLKTLDL